MIAAVADTHAVIWYLADDRRMSEQAKQFMDRVALEGDLVGIAAISFVEIIYLQGKGRIATHILQQIVNEVDNPESMFVSVTMEHLLALSVERVPYAEVPELPDRIIAATALHLNVPLISRDRAHAASSVETVW